MYVNLCFFSSFQVPGLHAPQPITAQPYGAVRWGPPKGSLFSFCWHAAVRHGEIPVRLPLPAYERQPAARLRQPDESGARYGFFTADGLPAHSGKIK